MPDIRLVFRDGHEERVPANPGESVLAAALRAGLPLVHQCESGSCGTCVARLQDGEVETVPDRALALLEGEVRDGYRLTCSTRPLADCTLVLDYPGTVITGPQPEFYKARVGALDWISRSVIRLDLIIEDAEDFEFTAGQYVRIKVPGTDQWRSYSMATAPGNLPRISFLVRYLDGGAMSEWLDRTAAPDTEIEIEGPMGSFGLLDETGPILMLAGGTGLAPLMAMLDALRARSGPTPDIALEFGCNTTQDLFFAEDLELREFWMPSLTVRTAVIEAPDEEFDGSIGDAVSLIEAADLEKPDLTAYLCGPPGMIEAARNRLIEGGILPERIRSEQFRPSDV